MSVKVLEGLVPAPMEVSDLGISFSREWDGDAVEIEVEYPDYGGWGPSSGTDTRYITISRKDWDAVVAHVAVQEATK